MGAAIARRLLSTEHDVAVWNRTPHKAQQVAELGARVVATPRDLAAAADVVITMLTDAAAIDATYDGPDGLLSADVRGKLFIEMSTVRPEVERSLAASVRAKGGALVECPVGGTVVPAEQGKLFGFAGAEAADFERAKPVLEQLCRRIEHVGPVGAGASMKLAINLPLLVYWQALGEALSLCRSLDIDPNRLMDIFADTSGGPNVLRARGGAIAASLKGEASGPVMFDVDLVRKDLATMIDEARAQGLSMPLTQRTLEVFDTLAVQGGGGADATTLPARWLGFAKR